MNRLILVCLLFITSLGISQGVITKDVGDFHALKVFDRINAVLISSTENKIEITGERSQEVTFVNKNGELKIKMALKKLMNGEDITVKVYFKSIDNVEAAEGAIVLSDHVFKNKLFGLSAKEGATISLQLEVQHLDVKLNSGGVITLSGSSDSQDVVITSGGILHAKDFKTSRSTASVNAGGTAEIHAVEFVDAKVRAGGTIIIYGKPKEINQKTMLGGTIEEAR